MSATTGVDEPHPIIIVKRHGSHDDEGHHGGVWKIAFADFMTAMMCFFLVMWLINAANEQTKAAVASYFNPVKLVDRNSSSKGIQDIGNSPNTGGTGSVETVVEVKADTTAEPAPETAASAQEAQADDAMTPDEKLFANPYAVLAEIARQTDVMQNLSERGDGGASEAGPATGASGGDSYRDPFAPDFWSQQVVPSAPTTRGTPKEPAQEHEVAQQLPPSQERRDDAAGAAETEQVAALEPAQSPMAAPKVPADVEEKQTGDDRAVEAGPDPSADLAPEGLDPTAQPPAPAASKQESEGPSAQAVKAAEDIKAEIAKAFDLRDRVTEGIAVTATDRGVTISMTDQLDFGMFEIGSALPRREMVLAMEKIGRIIEGRPGRVSVGGHTDSRPFRSADYDNWRLSSSRAQSAYYMLVRGGLDENRIGEVSGFADRKLKDETQPFAAVNRRIEILLEVDG